MNGLSSPQLAIGACARKGRVRFPGGLEAHL
jgi:hypothetical protein